MRTILLVVLLSFATACSKGMTRKEVIEAFEECNAAGLDAMVITNVMTYKPAEVHCANRRGEQ